MRGSITLTISWSRRSVVVAAVIALLTAFSAPVRHGGAKLSHASVDDTIAITGATLIDGSPRAPIKNTVVLIRGDSISAVGRAKQIKIPEGARVINAQGLVLAPGFIDTHNHSDRGLDQDPSAATQVSQGITTIAVGQDGGSEFPIGEYLKKLDDHPVALNVLTFVGHATLRSRVMGQDTNRHATAAEIEQMKQMV